MLARRAWVGVQCCSSTHLLCLQPQRFYFSKQKVARSAKDKQPRSYSYFVSEQFKQLKENNRAGSPTSYFKQIAEAWRSLSAEERKVYEDRALLNKQKSDEEYESLTEEEKAERVALKQKKLDKRHAMALRKESKESGKPVKPRSAWNYFVKENYEGQGRNIELFGKLKSRFDALSAEEKEKYEQMSRADWERYEYEMKGWIDKVRRDGLDHLITDQLVKKYQ